MKTNQNYPNLPGLQKMTDLNITAEDVTFCRKWIAEYEALAKAYEAKAALCAGRQRGAYLSNSKRLTRNRDRMSDNLTFQLNWLKINSPSVYDEVK